MLRDNEFYMQRALVLAAKGRGCTSPNPMVGCVIVRGGNIIAEGWHKRCGADHAEIMALKKAGTKARGARLFVTLEPCAHYGRTPPCVDQVIQSGVKEVIIAMRDPNPLTNGKSVDLLRNNGVKVKVGTGRKEAERLNEAYLKYMTRKMPFVVTKTAQTLDGKIATAAGHSRWITSARTRQWTHRQRDDFDAILVGIKTVLKDDPFLNGTRGSKRLKKIILDSSLSISPNASLFKDTVPGQVILAASQNADPQKAEVFRQKGVNVLHCPRRDGHLHLKWLFKELAKLEIACILVEGGAHVIGRVFKEGLVDKAQFFVAPKIIGDQKALSSVVGLAVQNVNRAVIFKELTCEKIGDDFLIVGYTGS